MEKTLELRAREHNPDVNYFAPDPISMSLGSDATFLRELIWSVVRGELLAFRMPSDTPSFPPLSEAVRDEVRLVAKKHQIFEFAHRIDARPTYASVLRQASGRDATGATPAVLPTSSPRDHAPPGYQRTAKEGSVAYPKRRPSLLSPWRGGSPLQGVLKPSRGPAWFRATRPVPTERGTTTRDSLSPVVAPESDHVRPPRGSIPVADALPLSKPPSSHRLLRTPFPLSTPGKLIPVASGGKAVDVGNCEDPLTPRPRDDVSLGESTDIIRCATSDLCVTIDGMDVTALLATGADYCVMCLALALEQKKVLTR
ncbi:hypothetical protein V5799_028915 [Amblyomma americanum]|uniref:Uncharacterized protein n=1 Tax=Amblyomma americanum TaxID=6943 RepID=A0AAQ4DBH8_AMBAM